MANVKLDGNVTDQNEVPVDGALVYVYDEPGGLADLYDSLGQAVTNPVTTGDDGYWSAYVEEERYYTLKYFWGGRLRLTDANVLAGDPPVGPNSDPNVRTDLASTAGAGLSGFSQSSTYTAGTVGASLKNFVSVKDAPYLAKGDGSTDDTLAFRAAIAAVETDGGSIWVPPGTYVLDNNGADMANYDAVLRVPANVSLLGAGRGVTILTHSDFGTDTNTGTSLVRLEGDEAAIVGITLKGQIDADSRNPRTGLTIEGASHCVVRDVHSKDFYLHAFMIQSVYPDHPDLTPGTPSNYNHVENFLFERGTGSAALIYSNPEHGVKNVGNRLVNGISRNADTYFGLEVRFSDKNHIENVTLTGNDTTNHAGLHIEQSANDNMFVNCVITGNANGVLVSGYGGRPKRNVFLNCQIDDNAQAAVLNNNGDYTKFIGGSLSRNGSRGYYDSNITSSPANYYVALELASGASTDWEEGETVTGGTSSATATILGFDPDALVLYLDADSLSGPFAVAETVTQGTNTGTISTTSFDVSLGVTLDNVDINDNASYGGAFAGGEVNVTRSRLIGNVDRGLSLATSCTGTVTGNTIRTTFSSSVTQCGDLFASGATKVNVSDNDLTLSKVPGEQAFSLGHFVPAVAAPHATTTTTMVKTTTSDSGAWTRSGLVRPGLAADEAYCDIPLGTFVGYPSTNLVFRFRVKDDGSARNLKWRSDPSGGSFTDVATSGSGEWEWITVSLTASAIEADHMLQLRKKSNDTATVLFDGYMIVEG